MRSINGSQTSTARLLLASRPRLALCIQHDVRMLRDQPRAHSLLSSHCPGPLPAPASHRAAYAALPAAPPLSVPEKLTALRLKISWLRLSTSAVPPSSAPAACPPCRSCSQLSGASASPSPCYSRHRWRALSSRPLKTPWARWSPPRPASPDTPTRWWSHAAPSHQERSRGFPGILLRRLQVDMHHACGAHHFRLLSYSNSSPYMRSLRSPFPPYSMIETLYRVILLSMCSTSLAASMQ